MNKNLKILISVIIFILFSLKLSAQNWPKIFSYNEITQTRDLLLDYDGGFIFCGDISEDGSYAGLGFLNKTDVNGETLWIKFFGNDEYNVGFNDVKKTNDNGYLLSGWTDKRLTYDWDPLFLKLNTCGEIEWCTILNSELGEGSDYAVDAVEIADGSIIGQLKYYGNQIQTIRISLVKMDNYGNPLWIKHLVQNDSTIFNEEGDDLMLTSDSCLLITGNLPSVPYFIKTDLLANELWSIKWIDEGGSHGISLNSVEDKYGNYYSTGNLNNSNHPRPGPVILKTDQNGNQLFSKIILGDTVMRGGSGPFKIFNDSLLIMGGGWSPVNHPIQEGYISIFVTDTLGNLLNMRNLIDYFDGPCGLEITSENKIVTIGTYYNAGKIKTYLWKLNMQLEDDSINNNTIIYDSLCSHTIVSDTLDINCDVFVNIGELPTQQEYNNPIKIWPNPTHEKTFIEVPYVSGSIIRIFNSSAIMVKELKVPINGILEINTINWTKGFYFVSLLNSETKIHVKKFIVN